MSDFDAEQNKIAAWLEPLADESAPCGPDLEYDNDFLALTQAATGKPESQFGPAEAPNWRDVVDLSEPLLDRSRDLRIAVPWLRAKLHLQGYGALPLGLRLINGMLTRFDVQVHPQPDPDDGDPYARVNTLSFLRESEGLIGDLRETLLIQDRAIGQLAIGAVLVALGQMTAAEGESAPGKEQVVRMLGDAADKSPGLRESCTSSVTLVHELMAIATEKLGNAAPDLQPLYAITRGIAGLLPAAGETAPAAADEADAGGSTGQGATGGPARGLSGAVNSREDAIRAIDLVCAYLERAEPTNPAPLFLRRARQLVGQNFLQLIKALAPEALAGVAGMVGVDPESVDGGDGATD